MGRTARGGATGTCITLLLQNELKLFKRVVEKIDGSAPEEVTVNIDSYITPDYNDASKSFDRIKSKYHSDKKYRKDDDSEVEEESQNDHKE